ncbi:MAG: hypothetical protein DKM50_08030 [Candidatus Margulisiibacteriota bacterium]|nr:MAG: hypothetical protein A2X43_10030 [Candidatus Margulisbacteria bacterium GWD2_39_127]OGI03096.1 MAG: hypothetical protein A2X42_00475 [Candidatus Margulisbacteria bacterium GWF2_38_17]OGI07690.1 MAG: hypothetical protein A2X41_04640 [Candidatus Margulisbacteria bacterium GWE2_39_32]PZM79643.1 MAG: hypothetical protein DKM50_08030 [Candidatus Margulisiibacteriota bacterium]HAR61889.1 hypothetical protein [Candidatus Margulisiibacteriota bacterium]
MDKLSININLTILIILCTVIVCIIYVTAKLRSLIRSHKFSRQKILSQKAEIAGAQLLQDKGFEVVEYQSAKNISIHVNNTEHSYRICADFLVQKDEYRFVAEIKNGLQNADISNIQTRRQLLEYYLAYDVDGILLVDMLNRNISLIQFDFDADS